MKREREAGSCRIVLADDHAFMRAGLKELLRQQVPWVDVVGEAGNGREAIQLAAELLPDIVLMDISMPELNGIEATRQINADKTARVIILSMHSDGSYVSAALKAGARGYLLKSGDVNELPTAIQEVMNDRIFLSPAITNVVVNDYLNGPPVGAPMVFSRLTAREREVLQLVAEGKTSRQMASMLFISSKTIETHRAQITQKLGIKTVAELTKFAVREGITSLH